MYSTCIFCNGSLGENEVIEHFPIGRRLAFDASKGRLWVVCRSCERWNLTPIEERWEAIEECERIFSETRLRASTDNIGLAKLREGLELVRIGTALRPEMAAWRYGDQFGRRRRKHMIYTGAGVAAVAGLVVLGPVTGVIAGGGWGTWQILQFGYNTYQARRVRVRMSVPGAEAPIALRKEQLEQAAVVRVDDQWGLRVFYKTGPNAERVGWDRGKGLTVGKGAEAELTLRGPDALRAAGKLLPAINEKGAKSNEVQGAVKLIGDIGDPSRLFERYAAASIPRTSPKYKLSGGKLMELPSEVRLALEMAAHEEQERRALEGELAILEAAWREAEEVAHIADNLLTPADTDERLTKLRTSG